MNSKKVYVSPQVMRVKLEPTQAVLSQCEVGATAPQDSNPAGFCNATTPCKAKNHGGSQAATS